MHMLSERCRPEKVKLGFNLGHKFSHNYLLHVENIDTIRAVEFFG